MAEKKQEKRKSRAWIWILAVVVVLGLVAGGYFLWPQEEIESVGKITFGVETSILPSAVWVADNKGYFEEEGLEGRNKGV